jgi:hypothetical protein
LIVVDGQHFVEAREFVRDVGDVALTDFDPTRHDCLAIAPGCLTNHDAGNINARDQALMRAFGQPLKRAAVSETDFQKLIFRLHVEHFDREAIHSGVFERH